jgi:hypothetical protein
LRRRVQKPERLLYLEYSIRWPLEYRIEDVYREYSAFFENR